jgi:hypothetical protein
LGSYRRVVARIDWTVGCIIAESTDDGERSESRRAAGTTVGRTVGRTVGTTVGRNLSGRLRGGHRRGEFESELELLAFCLESGGCLAELGGDIVACYLRCFEVELGEVPLIFERA